MGCWARANLRPEGHASMDCVLKDPGVNKSRCPCFPRIIQPRAGGDEPRIPIRSLNLPALPALSRSQSSCALVALLSQLGMEPAGPGHLGGKAV